jgi:hypothetical protein
MSRTKAALQLGLEINALREYREDDLQREYFTDDAQHVLVKEFVDWVIERHADNGLLELGLGRGILPELLKMAFDFALDLDDEYCYIDEAEPLLNYYRTAWTLDGHKLPVFNVRKSEAKNV